MTASLVGCNNPGLVHGLHLNRTGFLCGGQPNSKKASYGVHGLIYPIGGGITLLLFCWHEQFMVNRIMSLRTYMPYSPKTVGMNTSYGEGALEINFLRVVGKQSRIS